MNIYEAKRISIIDFLSSLDFEIVKIRGHQCWYKSPLRSECTASFKVDKRRNTWYDFGIGQGGDIVDLAKLLYNTVDISTALCKLANLEGTTIHQVHYHLDNYYQDNCQSHYQDDQELNIKPLHEMLDVRIEPLTNFALLSYLSSRRIERAIGQKYCKEIHYTLHGKQYYAIAFLNIGGGVEIRNPYFKGCLGRKNITIHSDRSGSHYIDCCIFEGFMDFLAYLTLRSSGNSTICIEKESDYLIMNSINNLRLSLEQLKKYEHIHCYLDNDMAGSKTTDTIIGLYGAKVVDESFRYAGYKDLNDFLLDKRK